MAIIQSPPAQLSPSQIAAIEAEAKEAGVLRQYRASVAAGNSERMALMLVMQRFPGLNGTDAKFNKLQGEQMQRDYADDTRERIIKIARRAGINTTGKTYNGQLGTYSDPRAWVSGTHDVRKTAEAKGLSVRGQVNVENEPIPIKKKKLSDRLLKETEQTYLKNDPALRERVRKKPSARKELREKIVAVHGSK